MKLVLTGSVSAGFEIASIEQDDLLADAMALDMLSKGRYAEAVAVKDPIELNGRHIACAEGVEFCVFSDSPGGGLTIYGPFESSDDVEEFGERYRDDGEEWALFAFDAEKDVQERLAPQP